jgi:hypothetical protein
MLLVQVGYAVLGYALSPVFSLMLICMIVLLLEKVSDSGYDL